MAVTIAGIAALVALAPGLLAGIAGIAAPISIAPGLIGWRVFGARAAPPALIVGRRRDTNGR
jgi:hypothetical protein